MGNIFGQREEQVGSKLWVNMVMKSPNTSTNSVQTLSLIFDTAGHCFILKFNSVKLY